MPTEPLSLFAQTLKELDDKFYATFPAAKQAAIERWQLKQAQADTYPPAFGTDRGVEAIYDSEACQSYPENIHYPNTGGELNAHYHYPAYVPTAPLQPPPHEVAYDDGHQFVSVSGLLGVWHTKCSMAHIAACPCDCASFSPRISSPI
ncbi:hypothetical protein BD779DRAFT_1049691 [Infundibulicybe gibba]|nr:hypothetical protein BD779DRAFT_1049691 [Infundibulicybe gibba]